MTPEERMGQAGGTSRTYKPGPKPNGGGADDPSWSEPIDCFATVNADPVDVTEDEAPPPLWPFICDTAERMGVACSTVTLGSVVTCSAVISDDWRLQPKQYDYTWTENARLWGNIVGPPSILKSPVIKVCTDPIERLEMSAQAVWREDMRRHKQLLAAWKDRTLPKPQPPKRPRYIVESTSIEALQEVLRDDDDEEARFTAPARKVLVRQDELSELLANLDRYSSGRQGGDRGAYLRLWNGGRFAIDRIERGSYSNNWSGCMLGGIQPEVIQRIAKQAVDDGLLQRFLYDVPAIGGGNGSDRRPSGAALDRYHRLIPALAGLHPPSMPDGPRHVVVLHADAHVNRERIDALARNVAAMPDTSARLQSALGKWPGQFSRLCLTFHLIDIADARARGDIGPPMDVVPVETAARAERYMRRVLLPHLLRADAVMFATVQTGHAKWIAGHILAHKLDRITVRDVMRNYGPLRAPEARNELDSVMDSLVTIDWLEPEPPRNAYAPISAWQVNPAVHARFTERAAQEAADRKERQQKERERRAAAHAAPSEENQDA
jgi:hypothetical protein